MLLRICLCFLSSAGSLRVLDIIDTAQRLDGARRHEWDAEDDVATLGDALVYGVEGADKNVDCNTSYDRATHCCALNRGGLPRRDLTRHYFLPYIFAPHTHHRVLLLALSFVLIRRS